MKKERKNLIGWSRYTYLMILTIAHYNKLSKRLRGYSPNFCKLPISISHRSKLKKELALLIEYLHSPVICIGYYNVQSDGVKS